jgi:hypothetical protein
MVHIIGSAIQTVLLGEGARSAHDMLQTLPELIQFDKHRKGNPPSNIECTVEDVFTNVLEFLWFTVARPVIRVLNLKTVWFIS